MKIILVPLIFFLVSTTSFANAELCGSNNEHSLQWGGRVYTLQVPCDMPEWDVTKPVPIKPDDAMEAARKGLAKIFSGKDVQAVTIGLRAFGASKSLSRWYYEIDFADLKGERPGHFRALVLMDGAVVTPVPVVE